PLDFRSSAAGEIDIVTDTSGLVQVSFFMHNRHDQRIGQTITYERSDGRPQANAVVVNSCNLLDEVEKFSLPVKKMIESASNLRRFCGPKDFWRFKLPRCFGRHLPDQPCAYSGRMVCRRHLNWGLGSPACDGVG